ncbi:MAG: hypothetical protein VX583_08620 [Bdellovibrionota bacterium]|nr:hypothetical protein [Pseudobdellovibrionaceae bacterium]|tara:strand:- start:32496 stop:33068 length:573 start_codon:yes stop_codon:yes gene_type:complete
MKTDESVDQQADPSEKTATAKGCIAPDELNDFALEVGKFIQYWGFKRIHGQIWTHIYLSNKPLDAKDLMARLGISKALVSITLKDLLEYDVVIEAGKGPSCTMTYEANPNLIKVILAVLKKRELSMLGKIQDSFEILKKLPSEKKAGVCSLNHGRIELMERLILKAQKQLNIILKLGSLDLKLWEKIPFR